MTSRRPVLPMGQPAPRGGSSGAGGVVRDASHTPFIWPRRRTGSIMGAGYAGSCVAAVQEAGAVTWVPGSEVGQASVGDAT